ncbi:MAG: tetratricopeptide repeat protein, partial [bacterium]
MTSTGRYTSPGAFFLYIASAINKILSNLKLNYKNLKKSLQNGISKILKRSEEATVLDKSTNSASLRPFVVGTDNNQESIYSDETSKELFNTAKEANKHLQKDLLCPESAPIHGLVAVRKFTTNPKTVIIHKQMQIKTSPAICQGNNIYDKAAETSYSIDVYWCDRGLALSDLGQFEDAMESYKRALEINPRSFKAFKNRANVLYRIGRYYEAIDDFRKALDINSQLIDAWYGMGNAMGKLGRYKEAVSAYENALKINISFIDAWVSRGVALGNMARYQEAAESFERALEINPSLKEALYGKYLALQKIKRGEELIKIIDKVIAMENAMVPQLIPSAGSASGNFLVPVRDDFAAYFLKAGSEFYKNEFFKD